jgi:hypothetical protein
MRYLADLNDLCRQGTGVKLDAFVYAYYGKFRALGEVPRHPSRGLQADDVESSQEITVNRSFRGRAFDEVAVSKEFLINPARRAGSPDRGSDARQPPRKRQNGQDT